MQLCSHRVDIGCVGLVVHMQVINPDFVCRKLKGGGWGGGGGE